jgi:nitrite reductase (NADH) small subunit
VSAAIMLVKNDWFSICGIDEIPLLGSRVVQAKNGDKGVEKSIDIAIFKVSETEVLAVRDQCPHKGGPLSQGIVHERTVTCPLHGWKIELDSGNAVAPDAGCTHAFAVKVEAGVVMLQVK